MNLARINRRTFLTISAVGCALSSSVAFSQGYPNKPIRIVVPYPPGGGGDTQSRMVGQLLSEELGQPIIVENRPGSNGWIGTQLVAKADPDGYTLLFTTATQILLTPLLHKGTDFKLEQLTPVVGLSKQPTIIVVPEKSPIRSVRDLIDLGKATDARVTFASAGVGSLSHILGERLNASAGTRYLHVPYKGTGALLNAVLAGEVTYGFVVGSAAIGQLKAGMLRPIAVVDTDRSPGMPEVPTLKEAGFETLTQTAWFALMAPAGSPSSIVDLLADRISRILRRPEIEAKLTDQAAVPWPAQPAELAAVLQAEAPLYAEAVKWVSEN